MATTPAPAHPLIPRVVELYTNVLRNLDGKAQFHEQVLKLVRDLEAYITATEAEKAAAKVIAGPGSSPNP